MTNWNLADVWETVARVQPNTLATSHIGVYPEDVEVVLKAHPAVADAAVVGVAIVTPSDGLQPDTYDLVAHVRRSLAAYKALRRVVVTADLGRSPSGKLDYKTLAVLAADSGDR